MIAKIGRSSNLLGALTYNNLKVEKGQGKILLMNNMRESASGIYSVTQLKKSFEQHLIANRNTEKHTLHISLNPAPEDRVSDEKYQEIAKEYMTIMGYGNQPFVVFKHTDIDRSHIHIVSVCVDEHGKKISDTFEKVRSMKACRDLEQKFGLSSITQKQQDAKNKVFKPVDYKSGNTKSQIASVIKYLPTYYKFQSFGEYNALLSLYNITMEKVEGKLQGSLKNGILYFPLNDKGEKAGNPFKSSLFGKDTGFESMLKHFKVCKKEMSNHQKREMISSKISKILRLSSNEKDFKSKLLANGIDTVIRENTQGRIYGTTYIDHDSKTVWNGSRLGKEFSANALNDKWSESNVLNKKTDDLQQVYLKNKHENNPTLSQMTHSLFDFLNDSMTEVNESFGGLIPDPLEDDFEEVDFANRMKKKILKKRK